MREMKSSISIRIFGYLQKYYHVKRPASTIDITAAEYKVLAAFMKNKGQILSRDQLIIAGFWGRI